MAETLLNRARLELSRTRPHVRGIALLAAVYFATGYGGLQFHSINEFATLLWAPTGISIAVLFLYGYRLWLGVALGALAVNLATGAALHTALLIAAGNALESLLAVYILKNYIVFDPFINHLKDSIGLMLAGAVGSIVSASVGVSALLWSGNIVSAQVSNTWFAWWVGDALGALVVGALVVRWLHKPRFVRTRQQWLEGFAALGTVLVLITLLAWTPYSAVGSISLLYVFLLALTWVALRAGPRFMTIALFAMWFISMTGLVWGYEFSGRPAPTAAGLVSAEMFLGVLSILFLILSSMVEERKENLRTLRHNVLELQRAVQKSKQADKAKNDFIAILAHELRNPMAAIMSALELTRQDTRNTAQHLKTVDTQMNTIVRLLDDLLDVTRITRKTFKLQLETISLQQAVERAIQTTRSFAHNYDHSLTLEAVPEQPVYVVGDAVRLEQVFVNLLFNAAKYTPPGGSITVRIEHEGKRARVRVRDSGIGIALDKFESIFEPFIQINPNPKVRAGTGLGLGLSLTKKLVELHKGVITAYSEGLGYGSEFSVTLPVVAEAPLPLQRPQQKRAPLKPRSLRILIVDDNKTAAQNMGKLLEFQKHEVVLAYDGAGALQAVESARPQVVLLDIGLPDIDGYEVGRLLRRNYADSLILVAMTGYGQEEDKQRTKEIGFDHHLVKPVGIADLTAVLRKLEIPTPEPLRTPHQR